MTSTCGWWSYAVVCSKGTRGVTSVTGWLTCLRKAPHSVPSRVCDRTVWEFAASIPPWLPYPLRSPTRWIGFLGACAKLWKVTINFVVSLLSPPVRLSPWNMSAPTERIFMKFDTWVFFENLLRNFDCCTVHFEDSLSIAHQQMH
jgi:hypothetical protein